MGRLARRSLVLLAAWVALCAPGAGARGDTRGDAESPRSRGELAPLAAPGFGGPVMGLPERPIDVNALATSPLTGPPAASAEEVDARIRTLAAEIADLSAKQKALAAASSVKAGGGVDGARPPAETPWEIFNNTIGVFIAAFAVTLLLTPLMRRLAIANNIIDHPNEVRKQHKLPVAYLGGVAVYLGIVAGIAFSYTAGWHGLMKAHESPGFTQALVPMSVLIGLTVIMIIGLLDDVINITPMQKVGGMLIAAAALAFEEVGVKVATQVFNQLTNLTGIQNWDIPIVPGLHIDIIYWVGTAIIAIFVLGACNALNLIDGLDGLCSGVTAIAGGALLFIALALAAADSGRLDTARIVLCLAMIGACLGFLPHNFNPASIFLGDAGSLMLGYLTIVIVLTLGDTGQTNLVLCGLIIFAVPIIDTSLAIVRRKLAGQSISSADDNHLHHILKRMLGVKGAVGVLYLMGAAFGALGIALQFSKSRVVYAMVLVMISFIGAIALKSARRKLLEDQAAKLRTAEAAAGAGVSGQPANGTVGTAAAAPLTPAALR
ncbi:hypothetical protein BH11PLA1_BH11PLA1_20460 [soil metagenome]